MDHALPLCRRPLGVSSGDHDHRTGTMHLLECDCVRRQWTQALPLRNYWHELVIFGEKANANGVASRGFSPAAAPSVSRQAYLDKALTNDFLV